MNRQWGQISPEQYQQFFENWKNNGLQHIWNALGDHCSSNVECGPDACCLQPNLTGKRAITDGIHIHWARLFLLSF